MTPSLSMNEAYLSWLNMNCRPYTDLNYCIIALNGEAGEVAEWHKKYNLRGNPTGDLSDQDLLEELGDVYFYLVKIAAIKGWTIEDVMRANIQKIDARVAAGKKSIA